MKYIQSKLKTLVTGTYLKTLKLFYLLWVIFAFILFSYSALHHKSSHISSSIIFHVFAVCIMFCNILFKLCSYCTTSSMTLSHAKTRGQETPFLSLVVSYHFTIVRITDPHLFSKSISKYG